MKTFLALTIVFVGIPFVWVLLKMSRWSAPLSGVVGLFMLTLGAYAPASGLMAFGGGLFLFSAAMFVLGSGRGGL